MTQKFEIFGQNFDHFCGLRGNCWPLWGCEKSFFTFFLNCSGVVLGMFRYYFRTWKAYFWVYLQLLRLIPELYTLLWGPADALLNFDYAFAGLFITVKRFSKLLLKHKLVLPTRPWQRFFFPWKSKVPVKTVFGPFFGFLHGCKFDFHAHFFGIFHGRSKFFTETS